MRHVAALALALLSCQPVFAGVQAVGSQADLRVYGGSPANTCAWPDTVLVHLTDAICSGTLINPEIVVYAAHCGTSVVAINFGENLQQSVPRTVVPTYCHLYPGHSPQNGSDFAYCKLAAPITDVPIVPILMGCELDALHDGKQVVLAGYGLDENKNVGIKHTVTTAAQYQVANKAFVGMDGKDTCNGDSGGPAFLQLTDADNLVGQADGSWRVFGVTSYGTSSTCGSGSFDSLLSDAVPWIEADSGVDVTPCHDANGLWLPTTDCGHFPMHPDAINSSWTQGCSTHDVSGYSATCGPPFDNSAGLRVAITHPTGDTVMRLGDNFTVQTQVSTSAATVAPVALQVTYDGNVVSGPVEVTLGVHTLLATATDAAGHTSITQVNVTADVPPKGGCAASTPSLWLCSLFMLARRRRLRQGVLSVAFLGFVACGQSTGVHFKSLNKSVQASGFRANGDLGETPAMVNTINGTVAGHAFTPATSLYAYAETQTSETSPVIPNLIVVAANDPGYCALVQSYSDSHADSYYTLQIFDSTPNADAPTDGVFKVLAPNDTPSSTGKYAYALFQMNDSTCANTLSDAQAAAVSGNVTIKTVLSPTGAYVIVTLDTLSFGPQHDIVSGTLTALGCTPPETQRTPDFECR